MRPELKRLARLQRLERVRAIAKQTAAAQAAEAEGTLAQLQTLAARTGELVAGYAGRRDAADGLALAQQGRFADGLQTIRATTLADAARARALADARQQDLARAERARAAVEDRARREEKGITAQSAAPALGTRKALGTGLE